MSANAGSRNSSNQSLTKLAVAARVLGKELRRLKLERMDLARADLRLGEKAYATGMAGGQAELVSKLDGVAQRVTQLRQHQAEAGSTFAEKAKAWAHRIARAVQVGALQLKRRHLLRRLGASLRQGGTNSSEEARSASAVADHITSVETAIADLRPQTYPWARRPLLITCLLLLLAAVGAFALRHKPTPVLAQQRGAAGRSSLSDEQMNKVIAQQQSFQQQMQQMVAEASRRETEQRQARIAAAERQYREQRDRERGEVEKKQREEAAERERVAAAEHARLEEKKHEVERRLAAEKTRQEQQQREAGAQREKERQEIAAREEQQKKGDAATFAKLEQQPSTSATVGTSSQLDLSTPRKAAQAFDEALERNDMKLASSLAVGDEKQLAITKAQHDFAQAVLRLQLSRAKRFGGDETIKLFDRNWSQADEHVEADKATVNHGIMSFSLEKRGATWKVDVRASTAGAAPDVLTLVKNLVNDIDEITGKTENGDYKSDKDVQNVLDAKLAAVAASQRGDGSAERSPPRSEDSFAIERWLRSRLAGGMTERQIVETSDLIAGKFASPEGAEIRERCFKGTGDQRQFDREMVYSISKGEYVPAAQTQAKRLNEEIEQMFPPRAVFETSIHQWKAKALPPIEEPIQQGPRPPGSLVKEHLETFENAMLHLADAYLSQRPNTGKSRLSYYSDVKGLQAGDVLYCRYESGGIFFQERPYFFWYRETPRGLEDLLRTLPKDHPIRQIGPPLEEAPPTLQLAMKANVATAEDIKKMAAESKARAEKERGSKLTGRDIFSLGLGILATKTIYDIMHPDNTSSAGIGSGDTAPSRRYTTCPECNGRGQVRDSITGEWRTCFRCSGNGQIEY